MSAIIYDRKTYKSFFEFKSFIEEAAFLLRTYLDKNNMTYESAIAEAIKDAAESVKIEEERQDRLVF